MIKLPWRFRRESSVGTGKVSSRSEKRLHRPGFRLFLEELESRNMLSVSLYGSNTLSPLGIASGHDGNIWFTEIRSIGYVNPATGQTQTYAVPNGDLLTGGIVGGPDGNIWFAEYNHVCYFNPTTSSFRFYGLPAGCHLLTTDGLNITMYWITGGMAGYGFGLSGEMTFGPDGNIWFTGLNAIGQLNPTTGAIRAFPTNDLCIGQITAGPDGNLWFVEARHIARINPTTGNIDSFPAWTELPMGGIQTGPDGNLWFTTFNGLDRIDPISGNIISYRLATNSLGGITSGPDGNLWFSVFGYGGQVASYNPSNGQLQIYRMSPDCANGAVIVGPDGNIWISGSHNLGEIGLPRTLQATSSSKSGKAGTQLSGVLAYFKDLANAGGSNINYTATIDWGDNAISQDISIGLVEADLNGGFQVSGAHTYEKPGTFEVFVTISKIDHSTGAIDMVTVVTTINIDLFGV